MVEGSNFASKSFQHRYSSIFYKGAYQSCSEISFSQQKQFAFIHKWPFWIVTLGCFLDLETCPLYVFLKVKNEAFCVFLLCFGDVLR